MVQLFRLEDPVKGVFSLEFLEPCRIDTDIGLISGECGPDSSSSLTEGDGRTPIFSQLEMGPAKRAAYQPNGDSSFAGGLALFRKMTFHRRTVTPQGGDEAVLGPCPALPLPVEGLIGAWQGCIEGGSSPMKEMLGMND
jgi:hypothetical protein